ncbi:MAG: hypothetical protein IJK66_03740 [Bacilli bacterium]|nr:hypothetical protein [Bacilli bacterium]
MNFDQFGKTYAELTEEERKIVDERMKELRKQEAELAEDELEKETGGTEFRFGELDSNALTEQELENTLGGVPYDVGEEQFKKRV